MEAFANKFEPVKPCKNGNQIYLEKGIKRGKMEKGEF
jgi:hypothetical protein